MSRTKWNGTFAFKVFALIAIIAPALAQSSTPPAPAASAIHTPQDKLLREIHQELIEINNTNAVGDCTEASRAMAGRLKASGDVDDEMQIIVSYEGPKIKRERLAVSNKCEPGPFDSVAAVSEIIESDTAGA